MADLGYYDMESGVFLEASAFPTVVNNLYGLTDYDELTARSEQASVRFEDASKQIKQLEARMAEIAQIKAHIIKYSRTGTLRRLQKVPPQE